MRTLLVAGHETTAMGMTWAFFHATKDQTVYKKVQEEIDKSNNILSDDLPYIDAVCQEALRLRPIPPFVFRTLKKPLKICGHQFSENDNVALCLMLLHRDSRTFMNPKEFQPERFLERVYSPFECMPFGHGHKRCIGSFFAQTEMRIVMASLLKRADFRVLLKSDPKLVLRHINAGPDRKIPVAVKLRNRYVH